MRMILAAALMLAAAPAAAQQNLDAVQIRVEQVAPGVAVLFGAGGNISLSYGADGNILIDDQFAPLTDQYRRRGRDPGPRPDPLRHQHPLAW